MWSSRVTIGRKASASSPASGHKGQGRCWLTLPTTSPTPLLDKEGSRGGFAHPREVLSTLLWPEHTPKAGRNSLNTALSSLRRQLEPPSVPAGSVIVTDYFSVWLNPDAVTTDVAGLEAALQSEKQASSDEERTQWLITAVELYRGELLPGFYDEWIEQERTRLEEAYLQALDRLTACLRRMNDFDRALHYARRAVKADPLREGAHQILMRLYADAGQPAAALEQYRELERLLKENLNSTPSAATRALAREISEREREHSAFALSSEQLSVSSNQKAEGRRRGRLRPTKEEKQQVTLSSPPPAVSRQSPAPILQFPLANHQPFTINHQPSTIGSLPLQFTRFFGREKEIARLRAMLLSDATRLLTLTGPGGSGKTRLAIEVGETLRSEFSGGVWFVPLADIADPHLILGNVRDTLQLPRSAEVEPLDQVAYALSRQPALLILDNVEHLLGKLGNWETEKFEEATFPNFPISQSPQLIIRTLLERVPTLTCLVTSRQRLDIEGERAVSLSPLPTPTLQEYSGVRVFQYSGNDLTTQTPEHPNTRTPEYLMSFSSVQLFVDRAQAVLSDFQITKRNAPTVAALCERLEGIPLAIELVATWAQTLTVGQMLSRLSRRFDLLVSRRKDLPERHRALWATVEWSYHLLSPELRQFFARLSVFRGGWTLEAAEAVCRDAGMQGYRDASLHPCIPASLDALRQLCERSLVIAEDVDGEMHYRLLETLREFGAEQLTAETSPTPLLSKEGKGEVAALSQQHANYFLSLAEKAEPHLFGAEQMTWLNRLEREHDNLRAALAWSLRFSPEFRVLSAECSDSGLSTQHSALEIALRLAGALYRFWFRRGRWKGRAFSLTIRATTRQRLRCWRKASRSGGRWQNPQSD